MSLKITVPPAGESITSGTIGQWYKKNGELVKEGELIVTIETDKVANDLEAESSGYLNILVNEGEDVEIGSVIGEITKKANQPTPAKKITDKKIEDKSNLPESKTLAQKNQEEKKVEADKIIKNEQKTQTTADTINLKSEVAKQQTPAQQSPKNKEIKSKKTSSDNTNRQTREKMSPLRRKIATHLVNAQNDSALLTTFNECDMSEIMNVRKKVQEDFVNKNGVKLGFMSFFIKAVVKALKEIPQINAQIDGQYIIKNNFYDIGVAVGTDKGLFVPVIKDCDKKSFAEIEKDIIKYAQKAKDGKITYDDMSGGVFTITNGGIYGSMLSTPILNPPQSGILGMHNIVQRPVAINGKVEIRPIMYLALTYDHRIVDGKEAVTFLIKTKECLETPLRLLLDES